MSKRKRQAGFTLVEVLVSSVVGVIVIASLGSVVWVVYKATDTWDPQLRASNELRNFQLAFYNDAAQVDETATPSLANCTKTTQCASPMILGLGRYDGNSVNTEFVTYCVTGQLATGLLIQRDFSGASQATEADCIKNGTVVSRDVVNWSWWYEKGDSTSQCPSPGAPRTDGSSRRGCIIVQMTVKETAVGGALLGGQDVYKSQTMLFYPRQDPTTLPAQVP